MVMSGGLTLLAAIVCLGYGVMALRLAERLRPGMSAGITVGDVGVLGYAVLGVLATLLNVVLPLGSMAAGAAVLLGVGLAVAGLRRLAGQAAAFGWTGVPTFVALASLCFVLGSLIPGSTTSHYDAGLYHIQAVRQIMEYPLIVGTANIHMRFGYNSSLFQTAALLSGGVSGLAGAITTNALLIALVTLAVLQRAGGFVAGCGRSVVFGLLVCAAAVFTPLLSLRGSAGTPNTDVPSGMMILYAFTLALVLSDLQRRDDSGDRRAGATFLLLVVAAIAVTLKLSAAPVVLLALLPLLAWRRAKIAGRDLALGIGAAIAIGLPWLARGIATSGCLAYPQPSSCLPVPWRINAAVARSDLDWMRSWARRPEMPPEVVLADWSWLPGWVAALAREPSRPIFVTLLVVALGLVLARLLLRGRLVTVSDGIPRAPAADIWIMAAIAAAGIAFWFFSAPLIRYGLSWLVLPLLLAIAHCWPTGLRWGERSLVVPDDRLAPPARRRAGLAAASVLAAADIAYAVQQPRRVLLATDVPRHPQVAVQERGVHAGIPVVVPVQGNQCWDAPRICTPQLRDGLIFAPLLWTWWVRDPS